MQRGGHKTLEHREESLKGAGKEMIDRSQDDARKTVMNREEKNGDEGDDGDDNDQDDNDDDGHVDSCENFDEANEEEMEDNSDGDDEDNDTDDIRVEYEEKPVTSEDYLGERNTT